VTEKAVLIISALVFLKSLVAIFAPATFVSKRLVKSLSEKKVGGERKKNINKQPNKNSPQQRFSTQSNPPVKTVT
jgi:hypothetical protein